MASTLFSFSAIFIAVLMLTTGIGLLNTTLSLRLTLENVPIQMTGLIMASYFFGLVLGGLYCHRLVERVGHIRAFATFAAAATAIALLHGLFFSAAAWAICRFLTGISTMGLYTVIESWLNESTEPCSRGRVLSVYMLSTYMGMAIGQQLLNVGSVLGHELFFVVGIFLALCMVPVSVTRSIHPELHKPERFNMVALIRKAPIGMLGCFTSGLLSSAFHSIGPVFGNRIGLTVTGLSWFMTAAIIGGLVLQWPIGKFSDRFDRTWVLAVLGVSIAAVSLIMMVIAKGAYILFLIVTGIYGGLVFTVYPVSVARAHDLFAPKDVIPVSSVLLIVYGIGASIGPIAATTAMALVNEPSGFFVHSLLISGVFGLLAFVLRRREGLEIVPVSEQVDFIPLRRTSTAALQIDPRAEEEMYDSSGIRCATYRHGVEKTSR